MTPSKPTYKLWDETAWKRSLFVAKNMKRSLGMGTVNGCEIVNEFEYLPSKVYFFCEDESTHDGYDNHHKRAESSYKNRPFLLHDNPLNIVGDSWWYYSLFTKVYVHLDSHMVQHIPTKIEKKILYNLKLLCLSSLFLI